MSQDLAQAAPKVQADARRLVAAKAFGKIGDQLADTKTILTWLVQSAGAPAWVTGLLVPIRESGSMLPQAWLARWVQTKPQRAQLCVTANLVQALACVAMAASAYLLPPTLGGGCLLLALTLFATARACSSIASKDVLGQTIPKGARGQVNGRATKVAGILGAALGIAAATFGQEITLHWVYALIVALAGLGFVGCALCYARMATADAKHNAKAAELGARAGIAAVLRDDALRRFVLARGLLLGVPLAAPYIVLLGQAQRASLSNLASFVLANGLATTLSSGRWGKLADRSGARCMALGGALASLTALGTFALTYWGKVSQLPAWVWPAIYLVYTVGYTGTRVGRKTYVVDMASGDTRTAYVATSNTAIALLLVAFAGLDSVIGQTWQNFSMLGYGCVSLAGVLACLRLSSTLPQDPPKKQKSR